MKVLLRNPRRELDVTGPRRVGDLLADTDVVEIRPVISGG